MAHLALFRKYRSQTFDDLIGQDHITRTLRNALRMDRVAHAYLFCGPRGTGKTSSARIFAKALNCTGPDPSHPLTSAPQEPCNSCANCANIAGGMSLDVIEMDAASNTGIDSVRDAIIGKVDFQPVEGRRKIYIVDEVHKLSSSAFAALLKTLEEPPSHLVFLLATTDPNDLPATILSRCQRFDFRRIGQGDIVERLRMICGREGIQADDDALDAIAQAAEGGLRDALVILEQANSFGDGHITAEVMTMLLGATDRGSLFELSDRILDGRTTEALELLDGLIRQGRDLTALARDMLGHVRGLLLARVAEKEAGHILNVSDEVLTQLKEQGRKFDEAVLIQAADELIDLEKKLKEPVHARLNWEVAIIKRLAALPATSTLQAPPAAARPQPAPPHREPAPTATYAPPEPRAPQPPAPQHAPSPQAPAPRQHPYPPAPPQAPAPPHPYPASPQHAPAPPHTQAPASQHPPAHQQAPPPAGPPPAPATNASGPVTMEAFQEVWPKFVDGVRRDKVGGSLHVFLADCRPYAVEGNVCLFVHPTGERLFLDKVETQKAGLSQRLSDLLGQPVQLRLRKVDPATLQATQRAASSAPATPEQAHLDFVEEARQMFGGKTS